MSTFEEPGPELEVLRYGDLTAGDEHAGRAGLTGAQVRSLRGHPYAEPTDIATVTVRGAAEPIGRLILLPGRAHVDGTRLRLGWGSGWQVDAAARGAGALMLLRAIGAYGSFGGCLLSADARAVYQAAGMTMVRMPRYVLLRRTRSFLRRALPRGGAIAAPVADVGLRALRAARRLGAGATTRGFALEEVSAFDRRSADIDRSRAERFYFERGAEELNWILSRPWWTGPGYGYRAFYLHRAGAPRPVGYALARIRPYGDVAVASILRTAVAGTEAGAAEALLALLLVALEAGDPDIVDCAGTDPALARAARRAGLIRHGHLDLGCHFGAAAAAALRSAGAGLGDFRLDMGEGDVALL